MAACGCEKELIQMQCIDSEMFTTNYIMCNLRAKLLLSCPILPFLLPIQSSGDSAMRVSGYDV
jgi:hypothetical protein